MLFLRAEPHLDRHSKQNSILCGISLIETTFFDKYIDKLDKMCYDNLAKPQHIFLDGRKKHGQQQPV